MSRKSPFIVALTLAAAGAPSAFADGNGTARPTAPAAAEPAPAPARSVPSPIRDGRGPADTVPAPIEDARAQGEPVAAPSEAVSPRSETFPRPAKAPRAAPVVPGAEPRATAAGSEPLAAPKLVVHTSRRMLYLVDGRDTLFAAPVAIGMGKDFEFNGRKYHFATPTGRRRILGKSPDPIWTPPDWHYYEKAARRGLEAVHLAPDTKVQLSDGTFLVVRDGEAGRINQFGYFAGFTPGNEIIFDGRIYIPPIASPQRKVPDALGPFKLDMGDGYLIHGTHIYNEESIGEAVSHGCVRMNNDDLTRLYEIVPVGTIVDIV